MIPETTQDAFIKAMTRFDQELRTSSEWADWEHDVRHIYAIEYQGRRYPVKHIISMATGAPKTGFSGGSEANSYVGRLGFTILKLRADPPQRVWWVNQGFSFQVERQGGYLWAPITDQRGAVPSHWETLSEVEEDDLIVHYREGHVRAVSRALGKAYASDQLVVSPLSFFRLASRDQTHCTAPSPLMCA